MLINSTKNFSLPDNKSELYLIIGNALTHSLYDGIDLVKLRVAEIIKARLFFEYCDNNHPIHLKKILNLYSIDSWKKYVHYVHQLGVIISEKTKEDPVREIYIPENDVDYQEKKHFIYTFCMQKVYTDDKDFTCIKSHPVYKDRKNNTYYIIFELFFIEKMYKSLYFVFKKVNDSLKGTKDYIRNIRSTLGEKFSEKVLLNEILKNSLGKKYKHLGYKELKGIGDPDYYIRDGKYIFLFENKDNLVDKGIIGLPDMDSFIDKLKSVFISSEEKDKAIRQLINNIEIIQNGKFSKDLGINPHNCIVYPIVVVDNTLFSLLGINSLINQWFYKELKGTDIDLQRVRNLTIIDMDTLITYQGLFPQKEYSLRTLIDGFWCYIKRQESNSTSISSKFNKNKSIKFYLDDNLRGVDIFTKEIIDLMHPLS